MIATATAEQFALAISAVLADPNVDMLISIFVSISVRDEAEVARAMIDSWKPWKLEKPMASSMMFRKETAERAVVLFQEAKVPLYEYPESASAAMGNPSRIADARIRLVKP